VGVVATSLARDGEKRLKAINVPAALSALNNQRNMQIAMPVEAVMLGYALARKGGRVR
jgi:hypothetical protein